MTVFACGFVIGFVATVIALLVGAATLLCRVARLPERPVDVAPSDVHQRVERAFRVDFETMVRERQLAHLERACCSLQPFGVFHVAGRRTDQ
jgi:hypothetical protein